MWKLVRGIKKLSFSLKDVRARAKSYHEVDKAKKPWGLSVMYDVAWRCDMN